jgi:hypothetical protein
MISPSVVTPATRSVERSSPLVDRSDVVEAPFLARVTTLRRSTLAHPRRRAAEARECLGLLLMVPPDPDLDCGY